MMDHRTLAGFRRDETLRGRQLNRQTLRRALGYVRPYRAILLGLLVTVMRRTLRGEPSRSRRPVPLRAE